MKKNQMRSELIRAHELLAAWTENYEAIRDRMDAARKVLFEQFCAHEPYLSEAFGNSSWAETFLRAARGGSYRPDLFCKACGGNAWPCRTMTELARGIAALDGEDTGIDPSDYELRVVKKPSSKRFPLAA